MSGQVMRFDKCQVSHPGDSRRAGMWQVRWKTLGHLSQQRSSPPFWQTAHQSSLGSSSGAAVFSASGCAADWDCCTFTALVLDLGAGAWGDTFCCCRGFDFAAVLLSGRLEPVVNFTSKENKSFVSFFLHRKCLYDHQLHATVSFKIKSV